MIPADSIRRRPLVWFFALAHAGSWIGWSPWWLSASGVGLFSYELPPSAVAGINQLGLFAGPFLAAFVVTRIDSGREGVARLWGRIVRWRVTPLAYLIALGIPLVVVGSYLVLPGSPRADEPVSFGVVALLVGTFVVYLLGGPFQEEPGWRGFALPRLQEALHPAAAALVLGVLHCLWHAPLFLTQEWDTPRQDVSQLAAYLVLVVSLSVVLSWLVNVGRGSVLIAILGHHAVNTYLSPVVGVYSLFAFALGAGGPAMIWAVVIAAIGQLLVALVFGEVVAQFPVSGGVYPWARRLWGRKWAWMTGWVYMLALVVTIASVSYGAGPFLAMLLGIDPSTTVTVACAVGVILIVTVLNLGGTSLLAKAAFFGFAAELAGALVVGGWLLLTERHHNLGALFDTAGVEGTGSYLPAFAAASLIGFYLYYGFEACGDVAEEVKNPGIKIPKAMRMTIYIGGAASFFITMALLLAVPDFGAVISGADPDPVTTVLKTAFGDVGFRIVLAVVLISFFSCALSLQAAASRLIYSYARDEMMPLSSLFKQFSQSRHVPPYALALSAIVPIAIVVGSQVSDNALTRIVSFASVGIYLSFMMVVLAALRARLRGWKPSGKFTLGGLGLVVNFAALAYQLVAITNMAWPRSPELAWYDNYLVLLSIAIIVGVGLVYLFFGNPHDRSDAPHGDAIPEGDTVR